MSELTKRAASFEELAIEVDLGKRIPNDAISTSRRTPDQVRGFLEVTEMIGALDTDSIGSVILKLLTTADVPFGRYGEYTRPKAQEVEKALAQNGNTQLNELPALSEEAIEVYSLIFPLVQKDPTLAAVFIDQVFPKSGLTFEQVAPLATNDELETLYKKLPAQAFKRDAAPSKEVVLFEQPNQLRLAAD